MQRCTDAARQLHGGDIGQHFRPVGGNHRYAAAATEAFCLQRLHHLAGAFAHFAVAGHLVAQEQAGFIVVAVETLHQQVGHQGRVVQVVVIHVTSGVRQSVRPIARPRCSTVNISAASRRLTSAAASRLEP